ncbi:MAG: radical SAM protein [Thermodesulfobacteriota bacterium]
MCCIQEKNNGEFLANLHRKVASLRVPLSGSLELTRRCNLRCVHCYHGSQADVARDASQELGREQWEAILEQAVREGCLFLLLTGGEPLLRKDFPDIYRRARELGIIVTVFTNATRVTDPVVSLFRELPPFAVEVSLYGAKAGTHDRITGVRGSFSKARKGMEKLLDAGVCVQMKTVVLSLNCDEISALEKMAEGMGVRFRLDAAVFPSLSGDPGPCAFRVHPEDAVKIEFANARRARQWADYHAKAACFKDGEKLYECGAGLGSFHVDFRGRLTPCLMVQSFNYDLGSGTFADGWKQLRNIRDVPAPGSFVCNTCRTRPYCDCCPAFFALENGAETRPSEFLCRMGQARVREILSGENARRIA